MPFKKSLLLAIILSLIPIVTAIQPSQNYQQIFLNPYYQQSLTAGTNNTYNLQVNTPDGYTSTTSAIISFNAQINGQTQNFTLWVNGQACNPNSYYIATAYSTTGNTQFSFDCSNIINQTGNYNVVLKSAVNTGSITGWLELTYMNNPTATATMGGTEYTSGQSAKAWLQLLNTQNGAITSAVCYLDIYYPHIPPSTSQFLENALMTNSHHDGIYYYDFIAPDIFGVFPEIARCYYNATTSPVNATNYTLKSGVVTAGTINSTQTLDGTYLIVKTDKNGGVTSDNRVNLTFNFTNYYEACKGVSENLMTSISLGWEGIWNTNTIGHEVIMYTYNYTSNNWIQLNNQINSGSGNTPFTVTNSIQTNNITKSLGINSTNPLLLRTADTPNTEGAKNFETDYLYASCDQLQNQNYQEVKGSSEMHVSQANGGYPFGATSLCNQGDLNNACSQFFTNQTLLNEPQGLIQENITITNIGNQNIQQTITYETPAGVDCTAIEYIQETRNGTITDLTNDTSYSTGNTGDNCELNIPITLQSTETGYSIQIIMQNYILWEILRANDLVKTMNGTIANYCNGLNYTYIIPINQTLNTTGDQLFCNRALDDLYWYDLYVAQETNIQTTSGDLEPILAEARFYLPEIKNHYDTILGDEERQTITSSINNLTTTIISTINNNSNLTTQQINNLTNLINNFSTTTNQEYNNLTNQLNQVINYTGNLTNQINNLYNLANTINQTTTNTLNNLLAINQTITQEFNITNTAIQNSLSTLTAQINSVNTSINTQIINSQNIIIGQIQSINTTLSSQIIGMQTNLTNQIINLANQIYANSNLTTEQYSNITNQINNLENNINQEYNNLTSQINNLNLNITTQILEINQTLNTIITTQNQLNQTTNNIYNKIIDLNNTMIIEFGLTNSLIIDAYNNLTNQMSAFQNTTNNQYNNINQSLANLTNITTINQNWLIMIWNYVTGYLTNLTLQINQTTNNNTQQINYLISLEQNETPTNLTATPTTIITNTSNCISGSNWNIEAIVLNQYNVQMTKPPLTNCFINSTQFPYTAMTYDSGTFTFTGLCPSPANWTWSIECN